MGAHSKPGGLTKQITGFNPIKPGEDPMKHYLQQSPLSGDFAKATAVKQANAMGINLRFGPNGPYIPEEQEAGGGGGGGGGGGRMGPREERKPIMRVGPRTTAEYVAENGGLSAPRESTLDKRALEGAQQNYEQARDQGPLSQESLEAARKYAESKGGSFDPGKGYTYAMADGGTLSPDSVDAARHFAKLKFGRMDPRTGAFANPGTGAYPMADGGTLPFEVGEPTLVGEEGPELILPRENGRGFVVPADLTKRLLPALPWMKPAKRAEGGELPPGVTPDVVREATAAGLMRGPQGEQERVLMDWQARASRAPIGTPLGPPDPQRRAAPALARNTERFLRSPQGAALMFQQGLQDQRVTQARDWQVQDRESAAAQAKAEREEAARTEAGQWDAVADAMTAGQNLFSETDVKLLRGISNPAAKRAALDTLTKLRLAEREERKAAEAAGKPPPAWATPVPGVPGKTIYGVGNNVMGQTGGEAPAPAPGARVMPVEGVPGEGVEMISDGQGGWKPSGRQFKWQGPQPGAPGYGVQPGGWQAVETKPVTRPVVNLEGKVVELPADYGTPPGWTELPAREGGPAGGGSPAAPARSASRFGAALGTDAVASPAPAPAAAPAPAPSAAEAPAAVATPPAWKPRAVVEQEAAATKRQEALNQEWAQAKDDVVKRLGIDEATLKAAAAAPPKVPSGELVYPVTAGLSMAVPSKVSGTISRARALLKDSGLNGDAKVKIGGKTYRLHEVLEARLQELAQQR